MAVPAQLPAQRQLPVPESKQVLSSHGGGEAASSASPFFWKITRPLCPHVLSSRPKGGISSCSNSLVIPTEAIASRSDAIPKRRTCPEPAKGICILVVDKICGNLYYVDRQRCIRCTILAKPAVVPNPPEPSRARAAHRAFSYSLGIVILSWPTTFRAWAIFS